MSEHQGIVIKKSHYKDNDGMITILTSKGLVSFLAKGIFKIASKNNNALNLYTYGTYELLDGNYKNTLKRATSIRNVMNAFSSLESLAALSLMGEATFCSINEYDDFDMMTSLNECISSIEDGLSPYLIAIEYLCLLLKKTGYGVDFSTLNGNADTLNQLLAVYNSEIFNFDILLDEMTSKSILQALIIYFEDSFGCTLRSKETIML